MRSGLKNNHRWAKANIAVIRILLLLNVTVVLTYITGIADILCYLFLKRSFGFMRSGIPDFFSDYIWPAHQTISLVSAALFITWFFRCYSNLYRLKVDFLHHRVWIIVSWFIPIVQWFLPYRIMKNMFVRTLESIGIPDAYDQRTMMRRLRSWWGLWLYFTIAGNLVYLLMLTGKSLSVATLGIIIIFTVFVTAIPLCRVTIRLIRQYDELEGQLTGRLVKETENEDPHELIDRV
jgi:hypothetical protein